MQTAQLPSNNQSQFMGLILNFLNLALHISINLLNREGQSLVHELLLFKMRFLVLQDEKLGYLCLLQNLPHCRSALHDADGGHLWLSQTRHLSVEHLVDHLSDKLSVVLATHLFRDVKTRLEMETFLDMQVELDTFESEFGYTVGSADNFVPNEELYVEVAYLSSTQI